VNPEDFTAPPEEKYLRKPNPGMILKAKSVLDLDLSRSILVGDNVSDMQAGKSAGIPNLYLVNNSAVLSDYFESYANLNECLVRLTDVFDF
jgi:D-glycero-D-manno-heptose 1,7-bisphosphate phosphatase